MNLEDINMDSLNEVISSLSPDDIEMLQGMAQSLFSSDGAESKKDEVKVEKHTKPEHEKKEPPPSFDLGSITKIASVMNLLSSDTKDPRCELLGALKPMLAEEKHDKVDQAIKMIRILSIIPKIKELQ